MNEVKVKFTRSDGQTLTFGEGSLHVTDITGIGKITPEIFTKKKAVGSGDIITGMRLPGREFSVTGDLSDAADNAEMLHRMNRFFNPEYTFEAEITHFGQTRKATGCYLRSFDSGHKNAYMPIKPKVEFLCQEAYFLSLDSFDGDISGAEGTFHFPFYTTAEKKVVFGVFLFSLGARLENDGDVPTALNIFMTFSGPVHNPEINQLGNRVVIVGDFYAGDRIEIDAAEKRIILNETENISNRLSRESQWSDLELPLGSTTVSVGAESGMNCVSCVLRFHKRYLGVD